LPIIFIISFSSVLSSLSLDMEAEGYCDTRLGLGLGGDNHEPWPQKKKEKPVVRLDLSFTLCPKNDAMDMDHHDKADGICFKSEEDEEYGIKRRDNSIDSNIDGSGRKKLRLTKEQSSLLEESFRRHTTLNPVPFWAALLVLFFSFLFLGQLLLAILLKATQIFHLLILIRYQKIKMIYVSFFLIYH